MKDPVAKILLAERRAEAELIRIKLDRLKLMARRVNLWKRILKQQEGGGDHDH